MLTLSPHAAHEHTPAIRECRLSSTSPAPGDITSTIAEPLLTASAFNITGKPVQDRHPYPHKTTVNLSVTEPGTDDSASHVYADCIGTPGNCDDPNDMVPEILARMPGKDTLLQGRPLVVQRDDVTRRYSVDTPPGGQRLENIDWQSLKSEAAIHVCLNKEEKGDSLYRKIIAAAHNNTGHCVAQEDVNQLRKTVADFTRQNPGLADQANQARENDSFFSLPVDQAIEAYKKEPHKDHPVFTPRPARSWLEPLVHLLAGALPLIHNALRGDPLLGPLPKKKVTAIELWDPSVAKAFHNYINNHNNMDLFLTSLKQSLQNAEKQGAPDTPGIQQGWKMYWQLANILETGATLTEEGSKRVQDFVAQYAKVVPVDAVTVPPTAKPGEPGFFSWMKQGVVNLWNSARDPLPFFTGAEGAALKTSNSYGSPCGDIRADDICDGIGNCYHNGSYWDESPGKISSILREFSNQTCPDCLIQTWAQLSSRDFCERLYQCWPMAESPDCDIVHNCKAIKEIPDFCKSSYWWPNDPFPVERWRCLDNSQYIANSLRCDNVPDCPDGSDEIDGGCCPEGVKPRYEHETITESPATPALDINGFIDILKERFTTNPNSTTTVLSSLLNNPVEPGASVIINQNSYLNFQYEGLKHGGYPKDNMFGIDFTYFDPDRVRGDHPNPGRSPGTAYVQLDMENLDIDACVTMWDKDDFEILAWTLNYNLLPDSNRRVNLQVAPSLETDAPPTTIPPSTTPPSTTSPTATPPPSTTTPAPAYCQDNLDPLSWHSYCELPASARKAPDDCQDYRHNIADNSLISSALRQIVDNITDYHIDLLKPVRKALKATPDGKRYSDDQLHSLLHSFHRHSTKAKKTVILHPQHMLSAYRDILQNIPPAANYKNAISQLPFSTPVWVKRTNRHPTLLIPYTLGEVLSGALSGYGSSQLILPPELEQFRLFMTAKNFSKVMNQAYLEQCQLPSIALNQAPRRHLDQCGYLLESLQENSFIISKINEIVDSIEYQADLKATIFQRLRLKSGTGIYQDDVLESFERQFNLLATMTKAQVEASVGIDRLHFLSQDKLSEYLHILQQAATEDEETAVSASPPTEYTTAAPTEPFTLSTRIWFKIRDKDSGLTLPIPFTITEVLNGYISGFNPEQFILPPKLEPVLLLLVDTNLAGKLEKVIIEKRGLELKQLLSDTYFPILFPDMWIEKIFYETKEKTGAMSNYWRLHDPMGDFWREFDNIYWGSPSGYDLLMNNYKYTNIKREKDQFRCLGGYCSEGNRKFGKALIDIDMPTELNKIKGQLSGATANFKALIDFNRNHRHPYFNKMNSPEYLESTITLGTDSSADGMGANPFITALQTYTQSPTGENLILDESQITLFSYLTGTHIKVSRDSLKPGIYTPGSDLQKWMILQGGESIKRALVGIEYFSVQRVDNIEDYISSLKEISNQLADQTKNYIDIIHHSYKESEDKLILNIFSEVTFILGFIPYVGDALELAIDYIIDEIEISIEDNPDQIKALRKEQKINLAIGASLAIVPGALGAIVGKVVSKAAKKMAGTAADKWVKKGAAKIDSVITGVDTRRLPVSRIDNVFARPGNVLAKNDDLIPVNKMTKADLTDGRPNIKLDANGNPKKPKVEPGSKDWNIRCGVRKKRMPKYEGFKCALTEIKDKVYQPENLVFATKDTKSDRLPTLYYSDANEGFGRLRQEHPFGALIADIYSPNSFKQAFFSDRKIFLDFRKEALSFYKQKKLTRQKFDLLCIKYKCRQLPQHGAYYYEAAFNPTQANAAMKHPSGGKIIMGEELEKIRANARSIYRRMKEVDEAAQALLSLSRNAARN